MQELKQIKLLLSIRYIFRIGYCKELLNSYEDKTNKYIQILEYILYYIVLYYIILYYIINAVNLLQVQFSATRMSIQREVSYEGYTE
jgi:UDP-N-acetylmuramyl pentapeptide phosphotransferase/UDP-N-acetylglucosamine-1-phosphate transferase